MSKSSRSALGRRRATSGALGGMLMSLVLASTGLAATWSDPVDVPAGGVVYGFVALPPSTAYVLYADGNLSMIRSTNSGSTWGSPVMLASDFEYAGAAISAHGPYVDVVWVKDGELHYARSSNGGSTFPTKKILATSSAESFFAYDVDRGPGGTVAVTWITDGTLRVRVSPNGGNNFGLRKTISENAGGFPADVEVGDGVVYIAYASSDLRLRMRRSLDRGSTWMSSVQLARNLDVDTSQRPFELEAVGKYAFLVFAAQAFGDFEIGFHGYIRFRQTANRGKTWSSKVNLSSASDQRKYSHSPVVSHSSGVTRVAFAQCVSNVYCDLGSSTDWKIIYRQTTNGISWTNPAAATDPIYDWGYPRGIGTAGKIMILFHDSFLGTRMTTRVV